MTETSTIRVLIVDAEEAVRESLAAFLDDYGFNTSSCSDAEEARALMMERPFDVCVVDPRLPGFSGEELILLASKRFPRQRYIIHTSSISDTLSPALKTAGLRPEDMFHKPIRVLSLLVKRIKELAAEAAAR